MIEFIKQSVGCPSVLRSFGHAVYNMRETLPSYKLKFLSNDKN